MDPETQRRKIEERLEIIDAIVWAADHGHELMDLVGSVDTVDDARRVLVESHGFNEITASAILETQVRRWARVEAQKIRAEQAELRSHLRALGG